MLKKAKNSLGVLKTPPVAYRWSEHPWLIGLSLGGGQGYFGQDIPGVTRAGGIYTGSQYTGTLPKTTNKFNS